MLLFYAPAAADLRPRVMASCGASVNPLTAMPDRSEMRARSRWAGVWALACRMTARGDIEPQGVAFQKTQLEFTQGRSTRDKGCSMKREIFVFGVAFALGFAVAPACAQTLKTVKERGSLLCGVSQGIAGFSLPDDKGNWSGIDVEFCRAIAAAIFN
ncbi:MAG TPA: hypothetical protein VFB88_08710, partial [Xanthobacteraceae bacterium]|nr:hypothetical protein [Xanthobacteraceae bacterium]